MSENDSPINRSMTVLDVVSEYPGTDEIFKSYDDVAKECICCNALFETLQTVAERYGLDIDELVNRLCNHVQTMGKNLTAGE